MLEIHPYLGVGPLRLGMSTVAAVSALGEQPHRYVKGTGSSAPTFGFRNDTIHVYFDSTGLCEAIELFGPADPHMQGMALIGEPYSSVKAWFEQRDPDIVPTDAGFISKAFGVGVYAPGAHKDPLEPVESVIVFAQGYYER